MDALPAAASRPPAYVYAPGDVYARGERERELCATASHPDWFYLGGLVAADVGAIWFGGSDLVKESGSLALRMSGPTLIGLAWGATIGGAWLALPKCAPNWVDTPPPEGEVHDDVPLALAIALLAGATAPIVNGIAVGDLPRAWSTDERMAHVIAAGVAGFGGALLPYLLPPRTWSAARALEHIRLGTGPGGRVFVGYTARF